MKQVFQPFFEKNYRHTSFPTSVVIVVNYTKHPFQIQVHDREQITKPSGEGHDSLLAMVAHEVHRKHGEKKPHGLMIILRIPTYLQTPCVIHFDDKWMRDIKTPATNEKYEGGHFADRDGRVVPCQNSDAVSAGVVLARKFAADAGRLVWSEDILDKAVGEVLKEFDEELGISRKPSEYVGQKT